MKKLICTFACFLVAALSADIVPGWKDLPAEKIRPERDNTPAVRTAPGKFTFSADFSVLKDERACWDIPIRMDLSEKKGFSLDFCCKGTISVSGFSVYLKSGNGWYKGGFEPSHEGKWHKIQFRKSMFPSTEGAVAGWKNVSVLRIGAWRCGTGKVSLGIAELSFIDEGPALIGVVRPDTCEANPRFREHKGGFYAYFSSTLKALEATGINTKEISDMELDPESVAGLKLLVFPYNPLLPKEKAQIVRDFTAGGGKLFACHSTDPEIRMALGLSEKAYNERNWRSSSETPIAVRNGFYLPHVWRYSRPDSKRQAYDLLLRVEPEWKSRLDSVRMRADRKKREQAAWIAAQPSKKGEWRAFWCHSARGMKGHDWDSSVRLLSENGFNALLPNLSWGGVAFYRSSVLPVHPTVKTEGDALKDCLSACRKYGVECHVWKVCWNLGRYHADKTTVERLRSEGRLQKDSKGAEIAWLCPSHPENLAMETDAFVEMAKSGVDGVHFDYIRYRDQDACFCDNCRNRFEKVIGQKVSDWPKSVRRGKDAALAVKWRKFRCDNITALVRRVSERVRREAPGVKISAAVFNSPKRDPDQIGQDWASWCRDGLLDFVCPMDYTGNFAALVNSQKQTLKGSPVKLRPGMGLSCWPDPENDGIKMTKQIGIVRDSGLDGFTVFELGSRAAEVLPVIHAGPVK